MDKENIVLSSKIAPEVYQTFKASIGLKGITIGQWVEEKITEEAANVKIEKQ